MNQISQGLDEEGEAGSISGFGSARFYDHLMKFMQGGVNKVVAGGSEVNAFDEYTLDNTDGTKSFYCGAKKFFVDENKPLEGGYIRNLYINLDVYQESFCGASNREFFYRPNHHEIIDSAPDFNRSSAVSSIDEGLKNLTDFIEDQFDKFNSIKMQTNPVYPNISGFVDTNYTNPGDVFTIKAFEKDSLTTDISFDYSLPANIQKAALFGAGFSNQDMLKLGSFPKSEQQELLAIMEFKEGFRKALAKEENTAGSSKSMPFTNFKNFGNISMTLDEQRTFLDILKQNENPLFEYVKNHINVIEPFHLSEQSSGGSNFESEYLSPQVMYSALLKDSDVPDGDKTTTNQVTSLTSITLADFQDALKSEDSENSLPNSPGPIIPSKIITLLATSFAQNPKDLLNDIKTEREVLVEELADSKSKRFRFFDYTKTKPDNLQNNLPIMKTSGNLQQMYQHLHITNQMSGNPQNRNPHYALNGYLQTSITIHGISGFLPGNKFQVNYLPDALKETTYFLCTGVSQELTDTGWTTTIDALLRRDPKKVNVNPIKYNLTVNNVYAGDAVGIEPVERPNIPVPIEEEDILDNEPLETIDVTDFYEMGTVVPYSMDFDTDHQFKRPTKPVTPGTIADEGEEARYNVVVDPYNPGASTFGFGQTDILTSDEYEAIVSYYSNVPEYKDLVEQDTYGNEIDARQQIESWLDNRYEVFSFMDMNVGTNIGASEDFAQTDGSAQENEYDKFNGPMVVYVKKDPPGSSTTNSTMTKIMAMAEALRQFQADDRERRENFADTSNYPEDEGGLPRESIQFEPERNYLDDVLKLFLSKDRNLLNLIHPGVTQFAEIEYTEETVFNEEILDVDAELGTVDDDFLQNELLFQEQEVIQPKMEIAASSVKLKRTFSVEHYIARGRLGPLGVFYWEPGAYIEALDGSGTPIEMSEQRRKKEYLKWAKSESGKKIPKPGWYYTAVTATNLPGYRGQSTFANGLETDDSYGGANNVMLFGSRPDHSRGYTAKYKNRSVHTIGYLGRQARVPIADADGKSFDKGRGTNQWAGGTDALDRQLRSALDEIIRDANAKDALNMKKGTRRVKVDEKLFKMYENSPFFPYPSDIATYNNPGQCPFYQESIDAAAIMGNVISRADFAAKNRLTET